MLIGQGTGVTITDIIPAKSRDVHKHMMRVVVKMYQHSFVVADKLYNKRIYR